MRHKTTECEKVSDLLLSGYRVADDNSQIVTHSFLYIIGVERSTEFLNSA
jgi:hypothetical protein